MAQINGPEQIKANTITRALLNTATAGSAVIAKILAGAGISLTYTGADSGTGDVTISASCFPVTGVVAKSSAYTLLTTDSGKMFDLTGSFALTLPSQSGASVGAPLWYHVRKRDGSGRCTIAPNGTDTIEGVNASIAVYQEWVSLFTYGSGWYFDPMGGRETVVNSGYVSVASGSANVTLSNPFTDGDVDTIEISFQDYVGSASSTLNLALLQSGTAGTIVGNSKTYTTSGTFAAVSGTALVLTNASTNPSNGKIILENFASATARGSSIETHANGSTASVDNTCSLSTSGAITSATLTPSTGTISSLLYNFRITRK